MTCIVSSGALNSTHSLRAGSSTTLVRLKPQGPGPNTGPERPVQRKFSTTLAPEIFREKNCSFLKLLPSSLFLYIQFLNAVNLVPRIKRCFGTRIVVFNIGNLSRKRELKQGQYCIYFYEGSQSLSSLRARGDHDPALHGSAPTLLRH